MSGTKSRPRVAILFEFAALNGGERSFLAVAELLRGEFELIPVAPPSGPLADALAAAGLTVVPSPLVDEAGRRLPKETSLVPLLQTLHALGVDLVHANSLVMGRIIGSLAPALAVPTTAHLRDIIGLSARAAADLNRNRRLVAVSHATRMFHVSQGIDTDRIATIHNGIDGERFHPETDGSPVRRELGIPADAPVLLAVGQIGLRKGWDVLADAVTLLAPSRPNLHLIAAGVRHGGKAETRDYDAKMRATLEAALPGRAHFVGTRTDVPALMAAADLLVHAARQEPFGRVLLEAAAAGLPIVATSVGGTTELLSDGESARLVPPGDPAALAAAVTELLANPDAAARFASNARDRVLAEFTVPTAANHLAAVWRDAIAGG